MNLRLEETVLRCVSISLLVAVAVLAGETARAVPVPQPLLPIVTTVLPANTPGVVLVNAKPDVWAMVDRFNPTPAKVRSPFKMPFLPATIDFTQDIQPWLGDEVAIALVPTAGSIEGSVLQTFDASVLLLAPIKDGDRFNRFLNKFKAARGKPDIERQYKGVTLLEWSAPAGEEPPAEAPGTTRRESQPLPIAQGQLPWSPSRFFESKAAKTDVPVFPLPPLSKPGVAPTPKPTPDPSDPQPSTSLKPKGLAIALLPGSVAVAMQAHTLEDLIDARSEQKPLAENPLFQRTLQHPQRGQSLVTSYGEVAAIAKFFWTIAKASPSAAFGFGLPPLDDNRLAALTKLYSTVDSHIWLQPEGIHSQVNVYYTTPQPALATRTTPDANQILTRLPAATYLSASSRNFKQQWQTAIADSPHDLTSELAIASFRNSIRTATGLDPEKDVVPWMDGEYAFFFFPTTGGFLNDMYPKLNLGVGLIIQTSDRAAAEAALKKLDQFIKKESKGEVAIVPKSLKGQPIVSWDGKDQGKTVSLLSYAWVDSKTLLLTTGVAPMGELNPKPYLPLHLNYTFQTATASFPVPNDGYLYVNMGATLAFFYNLILPSVSQTEMPFVQEFQRVAGTVRSISTSNSVTAEAQRVDTLWVLAPVKPTK